MKAILIKDCMDCPLKDIERNGAVYCESTATDLKRTRFASFVGTITGQTPIPNWCPLTDAEEKFQEFALNKSKSSSKGAPE